MRAFEFHAGEVMVYTRDVITIDLDFIAYVRERPSERDPQWSVHFAGGQINVTKPAYDRVMSAWKSE